jgi:hypothetical protein
MNNPIEAKSDELSLSTHPFIWFNVQVDPRVLKCMDILLAKLVRLIFMFQSGFYVYCLIHIMNSKIYLFLIIGVLVILIDGNYVAIFRRGKEYTWYAHASFN